MKSVPAIRPPDTDSAATRPRAYLRIKGMVCDRCISVVRQVLDQAGLDALDVQLGHITVGGPVTAEELTYLKTLLDEQGFELIDSDRPTDPKQQVFQRTKTFVDTYFAQDDLSESNSRLSTQLQELIGLQYDTISSQFAKVGGITLEQYIIGRRIDRAKEWLVYSDLSLTEIAYRTGYSSVQHLSNQFQQHTGFRPSYFRQVRRQKQELQQRGTAQTEIS